MPNHFQRRQRVAQQYLCVSPLPGKESQRRRPMLFPHRGQYTPCLGQSTSKDASKRRNDTRFIYFSRKQPRIRVSTPWMRMNRSKPLCLLANSLYGNWHSYLRERPTIELHLKTSKPKPPFFCDSSCMQRREASDGQLDQGRR